jgi:hypothetical protein
MMRNALVSVEVAKNFGRSICQGHLVIAGRGEQLGDSSAYFAGANHDDTFHTPSGSTREWFLVILFRHVSLNVKSTNNNQYINKQERPNATSRAASGAGRAP